jgi:hypothetical protein
MVTNAASGNSVSVASSINWAKFSNDTGGVTSITNAGSTQILTSANNLTFTLSGGTAGDRGDACNAIKEALNATHYMEVESLNGTTFILNGSGWTRTSGSKNQNFKWDDDTADHSIVVRHTGTVASVTTLFGNIDDEGAIFRIKRR